jgi:hypothetical protein
MDRVHRRRLTDLRTSLNVGRWLSDRRLGLNHVKTVYWLLISAVHRRFDGGGGWLRQGDGGSPEFEFSRATVVGFR